MRDISEFINKIHCGDCLDLMREMSDKSVDAIVTDPPAGIAFMGKEWDKDKGGRDQWITWMQEVSTECLRVIKPGGHALVWSIPRTSHWTAMAWENAGWEVRDKVIHIFGSGFPKSLDISKGIDKHDGKQMGWFGEWLRKWREENKIPQKEIAKLFPSKTGGLTGCVANWELGFNIPTVEQFNLMRDTFNLPFQYLEDIEREVIGQRTTGIGTGKGSTPIMGDGNRNITTPRTDAAKQWNGWGTALKPAHEDWLLFRKPVEGTIAQNVLKYGVGGINIDGCRIQTDELLNGGGGKLWSHYRDDTLENAQPKENLTGGRFPANLIHDGSDEVLEIFPNTKSGMMKHEVEAYGGENNTHFIRGRSGPSNQHGDSGSAARFFYCAKASPDERNMAMSNNKHPTVKSLELMRYLVRLVRQPGNTIVLDPFMGSGTTCIAAREEGCDYIGIEKDPESFETAKQRLGFW